MKYYRVLAVLTMLVALCVDHVIASLRFDFDGDGKTDPTVQGFTSPQGGPIYWYSLKSTGGVSVTQWGYGSTTGFSDWSASADYDGDGKTDIAVWREPFPEPNAPQAYFYILYSATGTYGVIPWGNARNSSHFDWPVRGDFDGDGKEDVAISRKIYGIGKTFFFILQSRDGFRLEQFGNLSDIANAGDYDGDGKTDLAVARALCYMQFDCQYDFYIKSSSDGSIRVRRFGYVEFDYPLPHADFDGDGKTDIAVWGGKLSQIGGTGLWKWIRSSDGVTEIVRWGMPEPHDHADPGDYDGDGRTDLAIYRRITYEDCNQQPSYFWIRGSSSGDQAIQFGACHNHPYYNY